MTSGPYSLDCKNCGEEIVFWQKIDDFEIKCEKCNSKNLVYNVWYSAYPKIK